MHPNSGIYAIFSVVLLTVSTKKKSMKIEGQFTFYHAKKLKRNSVITGEWHPVPLNGGVPLTGE